MDLTNMTKDEIEEQLNQINHHINKCEQTIEKNEKIIETMERMFLLTKTQEPKNNMENDINSMKNYNLQYKTMIERLLETQQLYLNHLKYMPGGQGALEAQSDFTSLITPLL